MRSSPSTRVLCLLLLGACPAGPGTGSESATGTTAAASTTERTPTTSSASATSTSGPGSEGTDAVTTLLTATTTDPTETTTGLTTDATTDPTTGVAACEAIVGAMDCPALVEVSGELTLEECMQCQGAPCGQDPLCDGQYPCVDGSIVLRGCCSDEQCAGLTPFCGMFIATNNVCVLSDDI